MYLKGHLVTYHYILLCYMYHSTDYYKKYITLHSYFVLILYNLYFYINIIKLKRLFGRQSQLWYFCVEQCKLTKIKKHDIYISNKYNKDKIIIKKTAIRSHLRHRTRGRSDRTLIRTAPRGVTLRLTFSNYNHSLYYVTLLRKTKPLFRY